MAPSDAPVAAHLDLVSAFPRKRFGAILADPPWRFVNRTGKIAAEYRRLRRYPTMSQDEIMALPIATVAAPQSHLYLWVPNALVRDGLEVMHRSEPFGQPVLVPDVVAFLSCSSQAERGTVELFPVDKALPLCIGDGHVGHVNVLRKPLRRVQGGATAIEAMAEEGELVAVRPAGGGA